MKQIARDVIGELLETGKQTGKQAAAVPGQLVRGNKKAQNQSPTKPVSEKSNTPVQKNIKNLDLLAGTKTSTDDQLAMMVKADNQNRQNRIDNIRQRLAQLKIKRYQEIQQNIQKVRKKKEEEIPTYMAGKPGAPRTSEEQLEIQEKQKKEMAKQQSSDSSATPPSGPKPKGSLFFAKQRKGSGELKMGKQG